MYRKQRYQDTIPHSQAPAAQIAKSHTIRHSERTAPKIKSAAPNEVYAFVLTPLYDQYTVTDTASARVRACSRYSATLCSQCYVMCWCELAAAVDVGYLHGSGGLMHSDVLIVHCGPAEHDTANATE